MKIDLICKLFGGLFGVIATGLVAYNWTGQIYYDLFPEKAPENPPKPPSTSGRVVSPTYFFISSTALYPASTSTPALL